MSEEIFTCDYCSQEYPTLLRFDILIDNGDGTSDDGLCCPDCIASFFTEDPESIAYMRIDRTSEIDNYISLNDDI